MTYSSAMVEAERSWPNGLEPQVGPSSLERGLTEKKRGAAAREYKREAQAGDSRVKQVRSA